MKKITIFALIMIVLFGYSVEAKKKALIELPMLKSNVDGFSQPLLEIDQETISFDEKNTTVTVQFKKIADFPHSYTPRIERLEISAIGSKNENVEIMLSPNYYEPAVSLAELNKLLKQPVGSTAKVKLGISTINDLQEIKDVEVQGLAITKLIIVDQAEFEEAVDFVLKIRDVVLSKYQSKLEELADYEHTFPSGIKWYDSSDPEAEEPEVDIPIEPAAMKKLTRADLLDGEVVVSKNVKKNRMACFNLIFDYEELCYSLIFWDTVIKYDGSDGTGYIVFIKIVKVNGEFKIVWIDVIDN